MKIKEENKNHFIVISNKNIYFFFYCRAKHKSIISHYTLYKKNDFNDRKNCHWGQCSKKKYTFYLIYS